MQAAAFQALGLPHTYEALRVTADELPGVVAMLRGGTYDGLNVTVPHKERVLSLVDVLAPSAKVAGAANTLVRGDDGRVVAHNTDGPALAAELRRLGSALAWSDVRALVLGAGGAARAAVTALGVHLGVRDIVVRARAFADVARRDAFVRTAPCTVGPQSWAPSPESEARTFAVVQATSAGMRGGDPGEDVAAQWRGPRCRRRPSRSTSSTPRVTRHGSRRPAPEGCAATTAWACWHARGRSRSSYGSGSKPRSAPCARLLNSSPVVRWPTRRILSLVPKNRQRLGYRRIVQLLVYLVIIPTVLLLLVGIVLMFIGSTFNLLFGLLTVSFVLVAVTGIVLVLVFLRREANLSELQADFVSKVSHELRTPLTSIRLFVETMMRSRGDAATEDKCLEALERETDRLTEVIERLLGWGRMEAGRRQFDLREESVSDVVNEAVEAFGHLRDHHPQLDFAVEVEPGLSPVRVDPQAMADAIGNLLSNALKYGGTPPIVRLRARRAPEGIAIEVTDNGEGIPRGEHRRIFEKFYRIDDRLSRQREGSGLGLAIVKHIVRAHRARIQLDSVNGRGSTFRILLPFAKPQDNDVSATAMDAKGA